MRYFLDTEFFEDGERRTIDLISIGIAAEDGRIYYAISLEFDQARADEWVKSNVQAKLPPRPTKTGPTGRQSNGVWKTRNQIRREILDFIGDDVPEFWGYYADYDWVAFCWLFGRMIDLPKSFPAYCRDIKQMMDSMGVESIPFKPEDEHSALSDAEWNRKAFDWLSKRATELQLTR
jgi:3' exoribonuclease, RNase T-like